MITNEEVLKLKKENGRKYSATLKREFPEYILEMNLYNKTHFESFDTMSFGQKLFNYIYKLTETPKCPICGSNVRFDEHEFKYFDHCSRACSNKDDDVKGKIKTTVMDRYGVDCITKYQGAKDKAKQTHLIHFGTKKIGWSDASVQKRKNTLLERYGVSHQFKSKDIIKKSFDTKLKRYGALNNVEKSRKTCIERYGVINYSMTDEYKERVKKTFQEKYNLPCAPRCMDMLRRTHKIKMDEYYEIYKNINPNLVLLTKKEDFKGRQYENEWICKQCGSKFTTSGKAGPHPRCKCEERPLKQNKLIEYIKTFYDGEIKTNDRKALKGKEIDIYLPGKNLGIEFNGLYWHSTVKHPEQTYHLNKTRLAEAAGIKLIQIFEDEWEFKQRIVKDKLKFMIAGDTFKTIYARKCTVRPIDKDTANKFNDKYHIQGSDKSSVFVGLFFKRYLVAVATFKFESKEKNSYILSRYSTISTRRVIGGLGKLLSWFIQNKSPSKITTFADRRYSSGNMYKTLGFTQDSVSPPYYWYTRNFINRIHRFNLRKNNIKVWDIFYDPSASESELAEKNGYKKIWDCGQIKFVLTLS